MYMEDYIKQLDMILSSTGEKMLSGAGSISHDEAVEKAKSEYENENSVKEKEVDISTSNSDVNAGCAYTSRVVER